MTELKLELRLIPRFERLSKLSEPTKPDAKVVTIKLDKPAKLDILGPITTELGLHTEARGILHFENAGTNKIVYIPQAVPSEESLQRMPAYHPMCDKKPSGETITLPENTRLELILKTPYVYLPNTSFSLTNFLGKENTTREDLTKEDMSDIYGFNFLIKMMKDSCCDSGFYEHSNQAKEIALKLRHNLSHSFSDYFKAGEGEFNVLSDKENWPWYVHAAVNFGVESLEEKRDFAKYLAAGLAKHRPTTKDVYAWEERNGKSPRKSSSGHKYKYTYNRRDISAPSYLEIVKSVTGVSLQGANGINARTLRKYFDKARKKYHI